MKISVVITAYNVSEWIEQAIESVLSQTYKNIELVVVEDCSTDDTLAILHKYRTKAIVLANTTNQGAGMSRRIGISKCTGDYILLLDGDDYITPTFINSLVECAKETDADVVSGGITVVNDERFGAYESTSYGNRVVEGAEQITEFFGEKIVFMNNKIIRRGLYDLVPYCAWRYIEDTPTIAKILYYSTKSAYVNDCGYVYRQQDKSLCHTASQFKNNLFRALCAKELYDFFSDKGEPYNKLFNIQQFLTYANAIIQQKPSDEEIDEWSEEWYSFSKALIHNLNIQ